LKPAFCIYLILLIAPFCICNAQSHYFKHYQVENGLSNNTVYCSLQDSRGFLWLGTKDGLNRFDGYTFKVFRHNPNDKYSISDNIVHALSLDSIGNIWVGTDKGLEKYNANLENFTRINTAGSKAVRSIKIDKNNNCWFVAGTSLNKYDCSSGKVTNYGPAQHFEATSITLSCGKVWVSSSNGTLEKLNATTNSFTSYNVFKHSNWVASNFIEKIYSVDDVKILIGTTSQGVKEFDCLKGNYTDLLTYNDDHTEIFVRDFLKYNDNQYWIATESGIYIYDLKDGSVKRLQKNDNDQYSLSDNAVYTLYKDREGGVWAGTYFGGLNYYSQQYSVFNKFYPSLGHSLKGNVVREICKDMYGNMWFGTEDNGLNKLSPDKKSWTHYCPNGNNGLSNRNIHGLIPHGKELFVGTFDRGLNVMDIAAGKVNRIYLASKESDKLRSNFIIGFCKTRSGLILTATSNGLYKYLEKSKDFTLVDKVPVHAFIYAIMEDHRSTVWLGMVNDGLYCYNPDNEKGYKIRFKGAAKALLNTTINGLFEDSNHKLWLATDGLGLWEYNVQTGSCRSYNLNNGFPSNHVYKILEDRNKNIWISTSHGLVCLNLADGKQKIYTQENGLLSNQFNYNSAYQDDDGTMYFGCLKGLVSFKPSAFKQSNISYPVYITGFQVHNKEIAVKGRESLLSKSIVVTKQIKLKYDQSSFSIDFAALNFSSAEMTRYKYMMRGLDKGWTELKQNRKVYFTQLSPGHYTFIIKAANSNGQWDSASTTLDIDIAPPIWKSVYAYLLYCILTVVGIYLLLKRYHHKTLQKNERLIEQLEHDKEKQIYAAKIEFFTNVAHEIRTPLTLIKGPMECIIKEVGPVPGVQDNLKIMEINTNRLLDLTNQLLDFRRTEMDGFRLSFVKTNISQVLADTFLQFKPLAEQKNLVYSLNQPNESLYAYIDTDAFTKIITNLFGNAVKYGYSFVEVNLLECSTNHSMFTIEFKNDGYIIPQEMREKVFEPFFRMKVAERHTGTGIGLPLSRSLTELHKGSLTVGEPLGNYNNVILSLPIHQDHEFDLTSAATSTNNLKAESPATEQYSKKPVILLVDDSPEILDFISKKLKSNYHILKAKNGKEAIDAIAKENVQLVVSDVMMPVMDGFDLCRSIKKDLAHSHIPVILLTAKTTLQSKIEGLDIGADAYLEKPFSPEHLQVQIASLLGNRDKIKQHFASSPVTHIKTIAHSKADEKFLEKLNTIICDNIQNKDLDVELIANLMNMSKPTLFRKIKAISNLTLNELVTITRLKAAATLLEEGTYKVYEIANMVGYNSQSHLGRNFLKHFGTTPTEYQQSRHKIYIDS
jgi:ligand-binding sensor domain-containing protein/signal transduction histidine kinase/DNA-binding response OmpR family regulator